MSCIIATLAASPFAMRHFLVKRSPTTFRDFEKEFLQYEKIIGVPIQPISGPDRFALAPAPVVGEKWKYMFLTPSFFQEGYTWAARDVPDAFYVREGQFSVTQAAKDQIVFLGGDDISKACFPMGEEEFSPTDITLLFQNGQIYPAQEKGSTLSMVRETQLSRLLMLQDMPKEMKIGTRWKSQSGRIRPFHGYSSNYEILGFSEILNRRTVNVRFEGTIPNLAALQGKRPEKAGKNEVIRQKHTGNAWFDLESGLLVRQETRIQTESRNVLGLDHPVNIDAKFIVHLFKA